MHPSLDEWGDWMRAAGMTEATVLTRTKGIRTLCAHVKLDDPREITSRHLIAWLGACRSPWTRQTYWFTARQWCAWLVATGVRDDDPTVRLPRPRQPRSLPRPVSDVVIGKLLRDPPGRRAYAYVVLAVFAGLRVHEIAKVAGEDVDAVGGWLYVLGKGGSNAVVPMHPAVADLARGMPEVGYWFYGVRDGHVCADSVSRVIANALRSVGSRAQPHQLRHSFATAIQRSTHDLRVTQELMRHELPSSTAIYTQVTNADKVAAIESLPWAVGT